MRAPKRHLLWFLVSASTGWLGCPAASPREQPALVEKPAAALPAQLVAADAAFRDYLRLTQLGTIPPEAQRHLDVLRALVRWKSDRGQRAVEPFEVALGRDATPEVEEAALVRLAVFHLNMGCEVNQLAPPIEMSRKQQDVYTDVLDASAFKQFQAAHELLRDAAVLGADRGTEIERLLALMPRHDGEVREACRQTRDVWAPDTSVGLDELAATACGDGEGALCWVWANWGGGGDDAWAAACDADVARACVAIADRKTVYGRTQSNSSEASEAELLYERACALGDSDGCRREFAIYVPERVDAYRRQCLDESDPLACLKLARGTPGPTDRPLWWACTSAAVPTDPAACREGDALGCAARAFALLPEQRHEVGLQSGPAADPARAALQCGEGDQEACIAGAAAYVETSRTCAGLLLLEACTRGRTDLCGFLPQGSPP